MRTARPSLSLSAASSSVLRTVQHTRSSPCVSAEASRTTYRISGACTRAFREHKVKVKRTTDAEQEKSRTESRIPMPTKWVTMRRFVRTVGQVKSEKVEKMDVEVNEEKEDVEVVEVDEEMADNNPELLQDLSFDDAIDKYQQSSGISVLAKFQARLDTIGKGGKIAVRPWYKDELVVPRKRKRPARPSRLPVMIVKPKTANPPAAIATPSTKPTAVPKPTRKRMAVKTTVRVVSRTKSKVVGKPAPRPEITTVRATKPNTRVTVKSKKTESPPAIAIAIPIPAPAPVVKSVRFLDATPQPVFYDLLAPTKDVKSPLTLKAGWTPLKRNVKYTSSLQATGFATMFECTSTSPQTITLKRRVLHRFKSVQSYVARRTSSGLGQLDYGNADYKLSLQAGKVVTAHDIGVWVDPSELRIPAGAYCAKFLHFGGFRDELGRRFVDADVPGTITRAGKVPVVWPTFGKKREMERWVKREFGVLGHAELEE